MPINYIRCDGCCRLYPDHHIFLTSPNRPQTRCCICIYKSRELDKYNQYYRFGTIEEEMHYVEHHKMCEYHIGKPIYTLQQVPKLVWEMTKLEL